MIQKILMRFRDVYKRQVVPTPVTDKAYCGVCIETEDQNAAKLMENMEYEIVM